MILQLTEIYAENWRSWKTLHLTELDDRGLTLIHGANGSGKSSIRMLIEYLLLDTLSDEYEVGDLPMNGNTECVISGKIVRGKDNIEIIKYRNHKENGNKTILKINGDDRLSHTDRRITQKNIERLLDITSDTLFASTLFSSESPNFPKSKESERKRILYQIINLDKYNTLLDITKNYIKEIKEKIQLNILKAEQSNKTIEDINLSLSETIESSEKYEETKQNRIKKLKEQLSELTLKDPNILRDQLKTLEDTLQEYDKDLYIELEKDYSKTVKEISIYEERIKAIKTTVKKTENNTCPILNIDCIKLIKNHEIAKKLSENDIEEHEKSITVLDFNLKNIIQRIREIDEVIQKNISIENNIDDLKKELNVLYNYNLLIKKRQEEIRQNINDVENEENLLRDIITKLREDKLREEKLIKDLENENIKLYNDLKYYEFWKKGFSTKGIPHLKSESFIESLELETNKILSLISNERVEIASQKELTSGEMKEAITYKLHSPDRGIKNFKAYSGGQKQRVLIADKLSFHTLLSKFNFILFDEVLELSLDEEGKASVLDLLKAYSKKVGSMFVISHDKGIQDRFDNVIKVEIENGVSTLC